jgi:gliding motility-associated-like protein
VSFRDPNSSFSRVWDFGDGKPTSSSANPFHVFEGGKIGDTTYTVTLTKNCNGGAATQVVVTVYALPKVDFNVDTNSVCAINDKATFTNLSDIGTYNWTFGDNTSSTTRSPIKTYSIGGLYDVTLIVKAKGCENSKTYQNMVKVNSLPSPDFVLDKYSGCAPLSVAVTNTTDTTVVPIKYWEWHFSNEFPDDTIADPGSINYSIAGTKQVTLKVTSTLGCKSTTSSIVNVITTPLSTFSISKSNFCSSDSTLVNYTGFAGPNAEFTWALNGGVSTPSSGKGPLWIKWDKGGVKSLSLTVKDSTCSSSTSNDVVVMISPSVTLKTSTDTICTAEEVIFNAEPKSLIDYKFYKNGIEMQSGDIPEYTSSSILDGDIFYAIGKDAKGCSSIKSNLKPIKVKVKPVVSLTSTENDNIICEGDNVQFSGVPSIYKGYTFFNFSQSLQSGINSTFNTTTIADNDSIFVEATNLNGCKKTSSNAFIFQVVEKITKPVVQCSNSTTTQVSFKWDSIPDATGYEISVNGNGFQSPSAGLKALNHTVSGLNSGDSVRILVRALGSFSCGNSIVSDTQMCYAKFCTPIPLKYNPYDTICSGESVVLKISGFKTNSYSVTWDGGLPSTDTTFTIQPLTSKEISAIIIDSNQISACRPYKTTFKIKVNQLPLVSISSDIPLTNCEGSKAVITALPDSYDKYTFYNGNKIVQSNWKNFVKITDLKDGVPIKVVATEKGCTSTSNLLVNTVVKPLAQPIVNCGSSTTSSIEFKWDAVAGATGYEVSVDGGNWITPSTGNNGLRHILNGLNPGNASYITVRAKSATICGTSPISLQASCFTLPCTAINYNVTPDQTICEGNTANLSISSVSIPNYSVSWNTINFNKNLTYSVKPKKDTTISAIVKNLNEANCPTVIKYSRIAVLKQPNVTLIMEPSVVCNSDSVTLIATPVEYENYKFYNGSALLNSGFESSFKTTKLKNGASAKVIARNGICIDTSNVITVTVNKPLERPIINSGNITSSSIEFVWDSVPEATGYMVSVNGKPYITPSSGNLGRSHIISGLSLNESRYAKVIALGVGACGNSDESDTIIRHTTGDIDSVCTAIKYTLTYHDSICDGDDFTARVTNINNLTSLLSWNGAFEDTVTIYNIAPIKTDTLSVVIRRTDEPFCPGVKKLVRITVNPKPNVTLSASIFNDSICEKEEISFFANPAGYDNYTFSSSGNILQNSNNNELVIPSISSSINLEVQVTDDIGCIGNSIVLPITMVQKPVITLSSNSVNGGQCIGNSLTVTANPSGFASYNFYDEGILTQNSTASNYTVPSISKSYKISANAIHPFGCVGDTTSILNVNLFQLPVVTLTSSDSDNSICDGQNITITASPNFLTKYDFYDASNNSLLQSSVTNSYTYTNLSVNKSIYVIGTDTNTCVGNKTSTTNIKVNPNPKMTSSNLLIICSNNTVEIPLESDLPSSYFWQASDNSNVAGENVIGKTSNTLKDTLKSSSIVQETVTYSVTPTTLVGCSGQPQIVSVKVNPTPVIIDYVDTICSGTNFNLVLNHQNPNNQIVPSNTTYTWPTPSFTSGIITGAIQQSTGLKTINQQLNNKSNTTSSVSYVITPKSGATGSCVGKTFNYKVVVNPTPEISNYQTDSICSDQTFSRIPMNGQPTSSTIVPTNTTYTWSQPIVLPNGSITGSNSQNIGLSEISETLTNQTLDFGTVNYVVTPISGNCIGQNFNVPILVKPVPKITNVLSKTFCSDNKVNVSVSSDINSTITWKANDNTLVLGETLNASVASTIIDNLRNISNEIQLVKYELSPTSEYGCLGLTKELTIQVNPKPVIKNYSTSICNNDSIKYIPKNLVVGDIVPVNTTYTWLISSKSPADSLIGSFDQTTPNILFEQKLSTKTISSNVKYKVVPISGEVGNCIGDTFEINIDVHPIPDPKVSISDTGICRGTEISLTTLLDETFYPSTTYSWNTGQSAKSFSLKPDQTTTFKLIATSNGCSSKPDSVHVDVDQVVPNANAGEGVTICRGDSLELKATGGKTYHWTYDKSISDTAISNPKVAPYVTTKYYLLVKNDYCFANSEVTITIDRCLKELPFKIPQVYSPNNDGANDVWELIDVDYFPKSKLLVFNRWGEIVYETGPYVNQWNGKNNAGDDLPDGTYYYVLDLGNGHELYKGYVVITR